MMEAWHQWSVEIRACLVALLSVAIGPIINWCIYNAAYFPRPISPWGRRRFHNEPSNKRWNEILERPSRDFVSRLPIAGWLRLRDEADLFGNWFWIRPLLIEILFPAFLGWLYWFEMTGNLLPDLARPPSNTWLLSLHCQYLAHAVLFVLLCVATFIDFDECTIPDWITVPGTLVALLASPWGNYWHLPIDLTHPTTNVWPSTLTYDLPRHVDSIAGANGLMICWGTFALWCFALLDRRWISRRGLRKAVQYFWARIVRSASWRWIVVVFVIGSLLIFFGWPQLNTASQQSLLSSFFGLLVGGLTVWLVRIICGMALGVEALGFGDVTLMAMVGAFLGWQPTVIAFFISPILAIAFVVVRFLITGDNQTPFGPYLCAGVLSTVLLWNHVWNHYFQDIVDVVGPSILASILLAALTLMAVLLWTWRLIKSTIHSSHPTSHH